MDFPRPSPVLGLIRRPVGSSQTPPPPTPPDPSLSPSNLQLRPSDGVVVVGFVSRRPEDSSQLINRVLDANIFGSGNLNRIPTVDRDEIKDWFRSRMIGYYHEEEKGFLFLQFSATRCPAFDGVSESGSCFESVLEAREFGDIQGLLFMFSVCHVIIYIQEGSHFDTQLLKKFRVLQAAKQALSPYVRSQSGHLPSRRSRTSPKPNSSVSPRGSGIINRNALMSGLGSYTSLFPGQCTPVTLFVFLDDFYDISNAGSSVEEATSHSSINNSGKLSRPTLQAKGPGSVVVLSRPESKSEGGLRKKLQSSLEAQIRFLIKKCRTLSGSESSHAGSRSGTVSSSAPLFSLDASKSVILLDRSSNKKGEALEFASSLVDDVLNGKAKSDSLLLENNGQTSTKEDVLSVKEFIYRCSDILRGKGGMSANSGAGMVAVAAAAAAAASGTSRKTFSAPQLPHLDEWLSCSCQILEGILTAKGVSIDELDINKKKLRERNISPLKDEVMSLKGAETPDLAVSWLGSGNDLNLKFSSLWCERALPVAKDVYLKDLPPCYATSVHETHLQNALSAFRSMVRGPSVELFTKRLMDECTSLWNSGRQLCDATSLTGRPCRHQRHNFGNDEVLPGAEVKPHSSGYVFLHACLCGRSRRLRPDPFDFESANLMFNCFPDCDKLLLSIRLPEVSHVGPIQSLSWSLVRVGGSRYYDPSKGLLQSGFCATQKFLSKWILFLEEKKPPKSLLPVDAIKDSMSRSNVVMPKTDTNRSKIDALQPNSRVVKKGEAVDNVKIKFGKGLPNFTTKKPFSEVVAGSVNKDLLFPPLQQSRLPSPALDKEAKPKGPSDRREKNVEDLSNQQSQEPEDIPRDIAATVGDPFMTTGNNIRTNLLPEHVTAYFGFEHECPRGHRFLVNTEHLTKLGPSYSVPEEYSSPNSAETSKLKVNISKVEKNSGYSKGRRKSNRMKSGDRPRQIISKDNFYVNNLLPGKKGNIISSATNTQVHNSDESGLAFSMLNRNLPIFMSCPHCSAASPEKDASDLRYAGTISQLQRIFLVTPPFPVVLATCPIVKFQEACLPPSVTNSEQKLQFSLGCPVILPPDSFLSLRLPFIYGVQLENGMQLPLNPFEQEPEKTAWIVGGTALQVLSKEGSLDRNVQT